MTYTAVTIASGADYNMNTSDTVASIEGEDIVIASSQTLAMMVMTRR